MKKKLFLFLVAAMAITGCSSTNSNGSYSGKTVSFNNTKQNQYPDWFLTPSFEGAVVATGSAKIGPAGLGFAKTQALLQARAELARTMEIKIKNLSKSFINQIGNTDDATVEMVATDVTKAVTNTTLRGSKQLDMFITPDKEVLVLVGVPTTTVIDDTKNAMNEAIKRERDLYQEFKANMGYKELDEEIEKTFNQSM